MHTHTTFNKEPYWRVPWRWIDFVRMVQKYNFRLLCNISLRANNLTNAHGPPVQRGTSLRQNANNFPYGES